MAVRCVICRVRETPRATRASDYDVDRALVRWVRCPRCSAERGGSLVHSICWECWTQWGLGSGIELWEWVDGLVEQTQFSTCPVSEDFRVARALMGGRP